MNARGLAAWFFAGLFSITATHAAPPVTGKITIPEVATHGLMPTQPTPDKTGTWVNVPYLKLYSEGRLLFSGMASAYQKVTAAQTLRKQPQVDPAIKVHSLVNELATLKIKRVGTGSTVVVVYVSDPCPPCDNLIEGAVSRLQPLGYGAVEQIRVLVR